jgi:hypothetical protein
LSGLDKSVLQIKSKIVSCHTADSKPVKQEVNSTVTLPLLYSLQKQSRSCLSQHLAAEKQCIFLPFQPTGISEEVFRQIETVQNRYDSSTAEAFRAVQKSGEMVVRTLDPRQFIRLASETAQKINIDTNVS